MKMVCFCFDISIYDDFKDYRFLSFFFSGNSILHLAVLKKNLSLVIEVANKYPKLSTIQNNEVNNK